jgi:predicted RNA-binding Zn-ribbon protein involved in translation (DUF1610 family)
MSTSVQTPTLSVGRLLRAQCPQCGSGEVWRTHRKTTFDWLLSPLSVRPYRCWTCGHRFHAVPSWRLLAPTPEEQKTKMNRGKEPRSLPALASKGPGKRNRLAHVSVVVLITAALVVWFLMSLTTTPGPA